jgi:DNA-binding MarR family transcriptional regulator
LRPASTDAKQIDNALSACSTLRVSISASGNNTSTINGSIRDELEVLFEETVDLANRLKNNARRLHRGDQLSASGRILLQLLQLRGPQTVPVLAHVRSTSRQNIQVLVDRLEASGYIAFVSNPGHKRSDFVALTETGRALLSSANERETDLLATLLPHTTEADVKNAAELLRKMRLLLGGERKRRKATPKSDDDAPAKSAPEPKVVVSPAHTFEAEDEYPVNLL